MRTVVNPRTRGQEWVQLNEKELNFDGTSFFVKFSIPKPISEIRFGQGSAAATTEAGERVVRHDARKTEETK